MFFYMAQDSTVSETEENTSQSDGVSKLPAIRPGKGDFFNGIRLDAVLLDGVDISEEASSATGLGGYVEVLGEGLKVIDSVALRFLGEQHTPQNLLIYDNEISFTIPNFEKVLGKGGKMEAEFLSLLNPKASFKLFNKLVYQTLEERQKAQKQKKQEREEGYNRAQANDLKTKDNLGNLLANAATESVGDILTGTSGGGLVNNSEKLKKALASKNNDLLKTEVERLVRENDIQTLKAEIKGDSDAASLQILQSGVQRLGAKLKSSVSATVQQQNGRVETASTQTKTVGGNFSVGGSAAVSQTQSAANTSVEASMGGDINQKTSLNTKGSNRAAVQAKQSLKTSSGDSVDFSQGGRVNSALNSSNEVISNFVGVQGKKQFQNQTRLDADSKDDSAGSESLNAKSAPELGGNFKANISSRNTGEADGSLSVETKNQAVSLQEAKSQGEINSKAQRGKIQKKEEVGISANTKISPPKNQNQSPGIEGQKTETQPEPGPKIQGTGKSKADVGRNLNIGAEAKIRERASGSSQASEFKARMDLMRENEALMQAKTSVKAPGGSLPIKDFLPGALVYAEKNKTARAASLPNLGQNTAQNVPEDEYKNTLEDQSGNIERSGPQGSESLSPGASSLKNKEFTASNSENLPEEEKPADIPQVGRSSMPLIQTANSSLGSYLKKEASQVALNSAKSMLVRIFGTSVLPYVLMGLGGIFALFFFMVLVVYGGCNYPVGKVSGLGYSLSYMGGAGFEHICEMVESASGGLMNSSSNSRVVPEGVLSTGSWTGAIVSAASRYAPVDACILRVVVQKESGGRADAIGCDCAYNGNPGACRNQPKTYYSGYDFNWEQCSYGIGITQWTIYQRGYANSATDFRRWQNASTPSRTPFGTSFYTVSDFLNPETSLNLTAEKFKRELDRNGGNVRAAFESYVGQSGSTQKFVDERMQLYNMCKAQGG